MRRRTGKRACARVMRCRAPQRHAENMVKRSRVVVAEAHTPPVRLQRRKIRRRCRQPTSAHNNRNANEQPPNEKMVNCERTAAVRGTNAITRCLYVYNQTIGIAIVELFREYRIIGENNPSPCPVHRLSYPIDWKTKLPGTVSFFNTPAALLFFLL